MKKKTRLCLCGVFLYFFILPALFAQEREIEVPASLDSKVNDRAWRESISAVKDSLDTLTRENDRLKKENEELVDKILSLQQTLKGKRKQAAGPVKQPQAAPKKEGKGERGRVLALQKEKERLENTLFNLQKENTPREETARLKLRPAKKAAEKKKIDSIAQERQRAMDFKIKQSSRQRQEAVLSREIEEFNANLLENRRKEIELAEDLAQMKEQSRTFEKAPAFKKNKNLTPEIAKVKKELKSSLTETTFLKKDRESSGWTGEKAIAKKISQKEKLENENHRLAQEISGREASLQNSAPASPADEEKLHVRVNTLERENEVFENRLLDLTAIASTLRRENAMAEDLIQLKEDSAGKADQATVTHIEALAYAYASQGNYRQAIEKYEEALAKGGEKKNIYFNLGSIYSHLGNIEEARKNYQQVLIIDPKDYEAKRNLNALKKEIK